MELYEGQVIKNYKVLCEEFLKVSPTKGNGRNYHFKELERYCEYHKEGQKIIIDKVFKKPKEKIDTKSKTGIMARINQGEYSKEVFPMVRNFVAKNPELECISKGKLLKELSLKNSNYDIARKYPKEVARYMSKILGEDIEIVTFAIYNNATEKINNAFKNLEKMKYIYSYSDKILTIYSDYKTNIATNLLSDKIENAIFVNRIEVLKKYLIKKGEMCDCDDYIEILQNEYNNDLELINKELKIQIFLRGLSDEVKLKTLKSLKELNIDDKVDNYYYSYGYIRNDDLIWDKELISLTQEQLCLENYKNKVKNDYIASVFAKNITKKLNKNSFKNTIIIRNELLKNLDNFKEKSDELFELFTNTNPKINISIHDLFNNEDENVPF